MQRIKDINGEHIEMQTDEARGGDTPHIVRYVLGISTVLAIIALSITWISGTFIA
ncbi:MAG: hypothetical protein R3E02_02705 [Blastomonas sp.]